VLGLRISSATIHRTVCCTVGDALVKLYLSQPQQREQQNLFVRSGKSDVKLALDVFTIEATDRHEALRGLLAH